jgi:hypothetical protein
MPRDDLIFSILADLLWMQEECDVQLFDVKENKSPTADAKEEEYHGE